MRKVLSLIYFFIFCQLYAQDIDRDYLITQFETINKYTNVSTKQDSLYNLSLKISRLNGKSAIPLFKTLDSIVVDEELKVSYLGNWAVTVARTGNSELSKKLRKKGYDIAIKYNNIYEQSNYANSLASLYVNISQADSATYYTKEAEKLWSLYPKKLDYESWSIYHRYYDIYGILGNSELQDSNIEKAWQLMSKYPNHKSKGFLLFLITDHFGKRKNYSKQTYYSEKLLDYYNKKKVNTPKYHLPVKSALLSDERSKNIEDLKRIISTSDSLNHLNTLAFSTATLSEIYMDNNTPELAIPILKRSISKLKNANYLVTHSNEYRLLQKAYIQSKDYKNAYDVLLDRKQLEDSLRSAQQLDKIADYEVKYATQEKERALEKKEADKKLLSWILALGTIILISLSYFFIKNRRKNHILAKQKVLLENALDEKNTLLKEVHHRVKNSFQIVSSLLYLQSESMDDDEAKLAIKEAENRVRSMVLVHQKLYNKDELVGINTKEYIHDLVTDIFESHQFKNEKINYNLNIEPMVLDIETITPIGLILNELIINTLKHAFDVVNEASQINVNFQKQNDQLILKVSDNGKGFEGEPSTSSFGLQLIKALSKKLKATLNYNSSINEGTEALLGITKYNIIT